MHEKGWTTIQAFTEIVTNLSLKIMNICQF